MQRFSLGWGVGWIVWVASSAAWATPPSDGGSYPSAHGTCQTASDCADSGVAYCVDGYCCNAECGAACAACDGANRGWSGATNGTCALAPPYELPPHGGCGGLLCQGYGACPARCGSDDDCAIGTRCVASQGTPTCAASLPNGSACSGSGSSRECLSGYCADGVCCDGECTGDCMACTAALKGSGQDGHCDVVTQGLSGRSTCQSFPPEACGQTGLCDGKGQCAYVTAGVTCSDPTCVCTLPDCAGTIATTYLCDGRGGCAHYPVQCGLAGCNATGTGCASQCGEDATACADDGGPDGAAGEPDDAAEDWANPTPARDATSSTESDSTAPTTDAPSGAAEAEANPSTTSDASSASTLDVAAETSTTGGECTSDRTAMVGGGTTTSCAPYACDNGACLTACTSGNDCSGTNVCDPDRHECAPFSPGGLPAACSYAPGSPRDGGVLVCLPLAALLGLRRRRARASVAAHR